MARFCALYTAASWAPGIVHITVMGDDCSVNSATVYFVFLYSVQVLLIRKTSSFSSDCCVAVAVSSADHSCALPVWIFRQCRYYDWLVAIQTIWKVLWERVQIPTKAIAEFFYRYVTLPFTDMIWCASVKCKQLPVYRVFWLLLPHPTADRNETRTWSSLSL